MRKLKGNWTDIFQGFSVALDLKKLSVAFIGLFLSFVVIYLIPFLIAHYLDATTAVTPLQCVKVMGVLATMALWKQVLLGVILAVLLLLIWSYFGGIITRIAAINLAKDEGLELNKAITFASRKYLALFSPYIFVVLGVLFFFLCTILLGVIGLIPAAGEIIVGLLFPVAIFAGFVMTFILVGFLFSSTLFFPTIAVESSDSFDAVSRSFQYIYSEPWRYMWYCLVSLVYGAITTIFVWGFGAIMITLAGFGPLLVMSSKLDITMPMTQRIGGFFALSWIVLVAGLLLSYVVAYCFSAHTIIYLLMRKRVDDIDMNEIYEEEEIPLAGAPGLPAEAPATHKTAGENEAANPNSADGANAEKGV